MDGLLQGFRPNIRRIAIDENYLGIEEEYSKLSLHNTNPFFIQTIQLTLILSSKSQQTSSTAIQKNNLPLRLKPQLIINAPDSPPKSNPNNPKIPHNPIIIPPLANAKTTNKQIRYNLYSQHVRFRIYYLVM